MEEKHISVPKTARYYQLGNPGPDIAELWIVLHGYGFLARDFIQNFSSLAKSNTVVVAPEALHRFYLKGTYSEVGASWMTREDRLNEVSDYINYLDTLYQALTRKLNQKVRINILGYSQGSAAVSRWVAAGGTRADRLILWGGMFPGDTDFSQLKKVIRSKPVQIIHGDSDPWVKWEALKEQLEQLEKNGFNFEHKTFSGGHLLNLQLVRQFL